MSGVRTGTRLEQLRALRARLDHEIAAELRRAAQEPDPRPVTTARKSSRRRPATPNATSQLLEQLGVTAADVRAWARESGRDVPAHGRLSLALVEAYARRGRGEQ